MTSFYTDSMFKFNSFYTDSMFKMTSFYTDSMFKRLVSIRFTYLKHYLVSLF